MPTKQSLQNFGSGIELLLNRLIAQKALENAQSSAEQSLLPARTAAGEANPSNFVLEPQFQPAAQAIQPDKMAVLMAAMRNVPGNPFLSQQFQQESQMRQAMAPKVEQIDPTKDLISISPTGQMNTVRRGTPKQNLGSKQWVSRNGKTVYDYPQMQEGDLPIEKQDQTPTRIYKTVNGKQMPYDRFYDTKDKSKFVEFPAGEMQDKPDEMTTTTKSMIETAPKVIRLIERSRNLIEKEANGLGPLKGRWAEFMQGTIGAPTPEYARLKMDLKLLTTQLMRMHVGARGGQYMMEAFKESLDAGKQDPKNLLATIDEIGLYANDILASKHQVGALPGSNSPTQLTEEDKQAIEWAKQNRNSSDVKVRSNAEKILKLHGIQ